MRCAWLGSLPDIPPMSLGRHLRRVCADSPLPWRHFAFQVSTLQSIPLTRRTGLFFASSPCEANIWSQTHRTDASWDYKAPFPWPTLEHLTLSHPNSDDAIYTILPSSIRSLSMHSWLSQVYDAHCRTGEMSLAAWSRLSRGAPLPASVTLRVLQACSTVAGHLTRLHTEYLADKEEDALLQCIASTSPSLTELEIHRQCPSDFIPQDPAWRMNTLGRACASLIQLRAPYVYTHLSDYPDREHGDLSYGKPTPHVRGDGSARCGYRSRKHAGTFGGDHRVFDTRQLLAALGHLQRRRRR
ncbi:hypothetical protein OH76DRAFT_496609 [Lentinus brumalis]|uniref:Uncharacterized protein n=1 Tax=Lentinus brumalis TaxID=2498619 RepID=A0A371DBK7_9APHY|nr:hypothetical protein OH76DRAFT_496609 [Polyporus brumalis]